MNKEQRKKLEAELMEVRLMRAFPPRDEITKSELVRKLPNQGLARKVLARLVKAGEVKWRSVYEMQRRGRPLELYQLTEAGRIRRAALEKDDFVVEVASSG